MRYIFILGCHKSGTSLLRSLFDGHPDMNVIPIESHFMEHLGISGHYPLRKNESQKNSFYDSLHELLKEYDESNSFFSDVNVKNKIAFENLKKYQSQLINPEIKGSFLHMSKAIFDSLNMQFDAEKDIVEKSVENFQYASYLRILFPNSIFIHILRNPYANLVSLRKFKTQKRFPSLPELIESIYLSFSYASINSKILDNYFTIKYEDLLLNPEAFIKNLAVKLDIPYNPILLKPTSMGENWKGNSMSSITLDTISQDGLAKWKKQISSIELAYVNKKISNHMKIWGYKKENSSLSKYKKLPNESIKTYLRNRLYLYF